MEYFLNEEGLIKVWDKTNLLLAEKMDKNASFALDGDKITGILPISKGGTGATTTAAANTALTVGTHNTATAVASLPKGITITELPATAVSAGDPQYGVMLTAYLNSTRGFQLGSINSGELRIRAIHTNHDGGYSSWYKLLSTREAVKIAEGGTGATDAATARANLGVTDSKVDMVNTEPTTETVWYPLSGLTDITNGTTLKNEGYRVRILQGTTSAAGKAQLVLGNSKATGTDGNKKGQLTLYSENTGHHIIQGASTTSNITHTFPAKSGTVLTTGNYPALTSCTGTLTVEKGGTGSATALGARQNLRIFYGTTAERDAHTAVAGDIWVLTD